MTSGFDSYFEKFLSSQIFLINLVLLISNHWVITALTLIANLLIKINFLINRISLQRDLKSDLLLK